MEITSKNINANVSQYVKQVEKPQQVAPMEQHQTPPRPKGDTVELSEEAKSLQRTEKALADVPDVREDKVAAIRNQLAQGTYRVDGQKIAFNMLKESILNEKV
ncbi:MAG: flagellar biosynthesis anti-sigma factor FlgM [Pseudomonadota bacterium]